MCLAALILDLRDSIVEKSTAPILDDCRRMLHREMRRRALVIHRSHVSITWSMLVGSFLALFRASLSEGRRSPHFRAKLCQSFCHMRMSQLTLVPAESWLHELASHEGSRSCRLESTGSAVLSTLRAMSQALRHNLHLVHASFEERTDTSRSRSHRSSEAIASHHSKAWKRST